MVFVYVSNKRQNFRTDSSDLQEYAKLVCGNSWPRPKNRRLQVINQIIFFNLDFILFWEIYTIKNFIFSQFEVDTNENKEIAELEPNSSITSPMWLWVI